MVFGTTARRRRQAALAFEASPVPASRRGAWIVFEGGEGCGKSTQVELLAERLGAVATREPGGTVIGSRIREITHDLSLDSMGARTEAFLMAADRAQHFDEVIAPTLASGRHVVADRSVYSSIAYQGFGRGLDPEWIWDLGFAAYHGTMPTVVVLLDVPEQVALERRRARQVDDRFEAELDDFHRRVVEGFREQAAASNRWVTVDGCGSIDVVSDRVIAALAGSPLLDQTDLGLVA